MLVSKRAIGVLYIGLPTNLVIRDKLARGCNSVCHFNIHVDPKQKDDCMNILIKMPNDVGLTFHATLLRTEILCINLKEKKEKKLTSEDARLM